MLCINKWIWSVFSSYGLLDLVQDSISLITFFSHRCSYSAHFRCLYLCFHRSCFAESPASIGTAEEVVETAHGLKKWWATKALRTDIAIVCGEEKNRWHDLFRNKRTLGSFRLEIR